MSSPSFSNSSSSSIFVYAVATYIIIIIIIIIDYSHMPIRHKKEKEKGDIKSYEHDKFTSRSSKGDTIPNTRRIERMSLEICMNLSEMFSFFM